MRYLIINADGYGFTEGGTRATEECIEFGTVKSLSANVNFVYADRLSSLVRKYPQLSIGCHVNPVVGRPVLNPGKVSTLINENGEFFYKEFSKHIRSGHIRLNELHAEMMAQINKTRELVGTSFFTHIDFHMALHRLPRVYKVFLDVVEKSGIGRIRTHRYLVGMESKFPIMRHFLHMFGEPTRMPKYLWNVWLRKRALARGFAMPDWRVEITNMANGSDKITVENYLLMLKNLPQGFSEFVAHPGYVDDELRRWSTYLNQRVQERKVLMSAEFKAAIYETDIHLAGYRDIPLNSIAK